jgi:hypothetical protein
MDIRILAAALSEPLGAPNIVTISNDSSSSANGNLAGVVFNSTGTFAKYVAGSLITTGNWLTPQTNMDEYEIYITSTSGDAPTGGSTLDTWLALSSTRNATLVTAVEDEILTGTITVQIRWTGDNSVQDTAVYTLTARGPTSIS